MTSRQVSVLKSFALALAVLTAGPALAQHQVTTRTDIAYVEHDGVRLTGDLYMPRDVAKAPIVIGIHGGGWQGGSPASYRHWGPYFAKHGIGLFAIKYRLAKAGTYPKAAYDVKAAIQFVRAKAGELGADPDRIGLQGDSAGGHLASLVGLAAGEFKSEHQNAPHAAVPAGVKTVVSVYGIYDMVAQWQHDQIARPRDQISEKFLGVTPMQNRKVYFEASPLSYATVDRNRTRFLLVHGTDDDIVDKAQAEVFWTALNQAQFYSRRVILPGAGHFFSSDPHDIPGSFSGMAAPRILQFLQGQL
jgi:acetyl esterase/lipase